MLGRVFACWYSSILYLSTTSTSRSEVNWAWTWTAPGRPRQCTPYLLQIPASGVWTGDRRNYSMTGKLRWIWTQSIVVWRLICFLHVYLVCPKKNHWSSSSSTLKRDNNVVYRVHMSGWMYHICDRGKPCWLLQCRVLKVLNWLSKSCLPISLLAAILIFFFATG
jgi:hypothetical protein